MISNNVNRIIRSKRSNRRSWIPITSFTSLFSSIFSTTNFISYCYYLSHNRMIFSLLFSFIIISITILFHISFIISFIIPFITFFITLFIILISSHYYRIIINLNFSLFFFFIISILLRNIYSTFLILY